MQQVMSHEREHHPNQYYNIMINKAKDRMVESVTCPILTLYRYAFINKPMAKCIETKANYSKDITMLAPIPTKCRDCLNF